MTRPVAVNDIYDGTGGAAVANENNELVGTANRVAPAAGEVNGLLFNDRDVDGDNPLTVTRVRDSSGTTTNIVGPSTEVDLPSGATITVQPDGAFVFDPADGFQSLGRGETATETLEYRIEDSKNERSSFAEVEFTIQGRNDSPVVEADVAAIEEDATASLNVLDNDSDVDDNDEFDIRNFQFVEFKVNGNVVSTNPNPTAADNIALTGFDQSGNITGPGFGGSDDYTISVDGETGDVTFEAGDNIKDALDEGDVGEITFRYRTQDDSGAGNDTSDYTTVKITISDDSPTVFGRPATLFVNARNNEVTGDGFFAGEDFDSVAGRTLFSDTDGSSNPNDAIKGTSGDDNIWAGNQGTDLVDAGEGDDVIGLRSGTVAAGPDDDFVYTTAEGGIIDVNLGGGFNNLWTLADSSTTVAFGNQGGLYGYSDGDDTLDTGSGDDFVYQIEGQAAGGVKDFNLGDGNNTVVLGEVDSSDIRTGSGIDIVELGDGSHFVATGGGNDIISITGGRGDDVISLGGGDDYVELSGSNDLVVGGGGSDTVLSGGGNDIIDGENGSDFLYGQDGNDVIDGGNGDDLLSGGAGSNDLTGGTGADIFALSESGLQVITDFSIADDDQIGLTGGLRFEDLEITRLGAFNTPSRFNVLIQDGGQNIALVQNVTSSTAAELQVNEFLYTNV